MRVIIWWCASVCIAACAAETPTNTSQRDPADEEEATATEELRAPVIVNAGASDSLESIQAAAIAASAPACHGTTSCPGGTLISGTFTVDCGATVCSLTGCPMTPDGVLRVRVAQPREQYQAFAMPNGTVCLAYHPTTHRLVNGCCVVDDN